MIYRDTMVRLDANNQPVGDPIPVYMGAAKTTGVQTDGVGLYVESKRVATCPPGTERPPTGPGSAKYLHDGITYDTDGDAQWAYDRNGRRHHLTIPLRVFTT